MNITTIGLIVTVALGLLSAPLLSDAQPRANVPRIGLLADSTRRPEAEGAARVLGVHLQSLAVQSPDDFEAAFAAATREQADGLVVFNCLITNREPLRVAELAAKHRLPAMYQSRQFVEAGGLMSYGVNFSDRYRRVAAYVDKILKGAKPADLPVEQPIKFEFVINLQAAKQIGLTIPPNVLVRADKVIK